MTIIIELAKHGQAGALVLVHSGQRVTESMSPAWCEVVKVMSYLSVLVASCEALLLLLLVLCACITAGTCRLSRIFGHARSAQRHAARQPRQPRQQERHEESTDEPAQSSSVRTSEASHRSAEAKSLMRRLENEERYAQRLGHIQQAAFLADLRRNLVVQRRDTVIARAASARADRQLRADVARAACGIARWQDQSRAPTATRPRPSASPGGGATVRVSPEHGGIGQSPSHRSRLVRRFSA